MPQKARGKDVAPTVRGAFIRAVKGLEDKGKPLSTMIMESLEKDFTGTLRAVASFVPKELMVGGDEDNPLKTINEIRVTFVESESSDPEGV